MSSEDPKTIDMVNEPAVVRNVGPPFMVRGVANGMMFVSPQMSTDEELQDQAKAAGKPDSVILILDDGSGQESFAVLGSRRDVDRLIKSLKDLRDKTWPLEEGDPVKAAASGN